MARRRHGLIGLLCLLLAAAAWAEDGLMEALTKRGGRPAAEQEFLPPDEAFVFSYDRSAAGGLQIDWEIAPGYYLYRDKIRFEPLGAGIELGAPELPPSESKDDPEFGVVQVYHGHQRARLPVVARRGDEPSSVRVTYQGCAEKGICYPPIKKVVKLGAAILASSASASAPSAEVPAVPGPRPAAAPPEASETDDLAAKLDHLPLPGVVALFFGFGLLLALTPCVFPMVPILSGLIVGQKQPVTPGRGVLLTLVYVLAMASTYALVGLIAGLFGSNLQAAFQHPAVLVAFSAVFVLLALSMFGFYQLQLPPAWQTRLDGLSRKRAGGNFFAVAIMGALSAIIVGPCVAPPLAGALLYLGRQGSPLVGGIALFVLGLGMGAPLLAVGLSAGHLLPRAGIWMETVKQTFGVVFLGVAISFLSRLLPGPATLALWALLLIGSAIYLGALEPLQDAASGWQRFWKGIGLALLCYGVILIVGAAAGAGDPFAPLKPLTATARERGTTELPFANVKGTAGFDAALAAAAAKGRPVMLDFYADWCVSCKELERDTFSHPEVQAALKRAVLLRADVTPSDEADETLLKRFELQGPPAVLFFDVNGRERRRQRLEGYKGPAEFAARARAAFGS